MTAADRAAAKPWVLRIVQNPTGSFKQLAQNTALGNYREQQLRLLNGFYAGGEPAPGTLVKTIQ
jgi:predicted Zn-dependent protease